MSKKFLSVLLAIVMVLTIAPVSAFAEDDILSYLTYEINNGEVTITNCNRAISGEVVIPDTIEGYPVTSIGNAFSMCDALTSVTIPDSVTSIGKIAFALCYALTNITVAENNAYYSSDEYGVLFNKDKTELIKYPRCIDRTEYVIPNSVTSIDSEAFSGCYALTSVTIPNSVTTIGEGAFEYCDALTNVTIPDSVTSIGSSAFYGTAYYNESSNWENGVLYIGKHLIKAKTGITECVIKEGTLTIASEAFHYHRALESITIPDSVTSIGDSAFLNCDSLANITVAENNAYYSSDEYGVLFNKDKIELIQYPTGNDRTEYVIPDSVASIGDRAFYYCTALASITIPDNVTSIGDSAFWHCDALTSVTIGNGVTSIGDDAFANCDALTSVTIGNNVTSIGDEAFYDCYALTSVTIPDSVTSIGNYAFGYYLDETLRERLVDGFTIYGHIGSVAETYANKKGITFIALESGEDVVVPDEPVTEEPTPDEPVTEEPTPDEPVTEEPTPDEPVEDTPADILGYLTYVINNGEVTITGYDESISGEVTIPDTIEGYPVTSIDEYAFSYCDALTSVTIPDCVTSIGSGAFYNTAYYNNESNWENGVLYINNHLIAAKDDITECTIKEGILTIADCAFSDCAALTSVTIPNSVTSIGYGAFYECLSLTNITVAENNAYYSNDEYGVLFNKDKTELIQYPTGNDRTAYVIPDSVTSISSSGFENCDSLTSVKIGNGVTSIGDREFYDCTALASITIPDNVTSIGDSAFSGCDALTSITIPDSVTSIGDSVFSFCDALTSVKISDSITSISYQAFWHCDALTSITIPDSVTSIGDYAFEDCDALKSVTIPDSVTSIGYQAFGFYFDDLVDGFIIYGVAGTTAETYANENGITFIALEPGDNIVVPDEPVTEEPIPDEPVQDKESNVLKPNVDSHIFVADTVATINPETDLSSFRGNITNENVQILDKDNNELATDAFVGTGAKINILDADGKVLSTYEVMVKSDVDGNGKVTPADARLALRAAAGLDTLAGVYETAANFDEKDTISTSDARMILRKAAGLE